jgi:hypothetical protein
VHNVASIRPDRLPSFLLADLSFVNLLEVHLIFADLSDLSFLSGSMFAKLELCELCFTLCLTLASEMNRFCVMKRLAACVLVGMIAGCAQGPSPRESADANYGAPLSINYRETIRDQMDPTFFYWRTAQYRFSEPYPGWFQDPEELGGKIHFGYKIDVLINARMPNGKYIGFKPYMFLFRDNMLIRELSPETGAKRSERPYRE